jgi:hypothetical protein
MAKVAHMGRRHSLPGAGVAGAQRLAGLQHKRGMNRRFALRAGRPGGCPQYGPWRVA